MSRLAGPQRSGRSMEREGINAEVWEVSRLGNLNNSERGSEPMRSG